MRGLGLTLTLTLAMVLMLAPLPIRAQPQGVPQPLDTQPGYFPDEYLELLAPDDVAIEINLQGAMLRMIAAFAGAEDPEFAALVTALHGIRVRSGEIAPGELEGVRQRLASGQKWLQRHGWLAMVRVKEEGEEVYIYSREQEGDLVGLTVLALEDSEVTVVNLIGRIDPSQLARLVEGLDLGVLDDIDLRLDRQPGGES
jgi:hypothetical protein